MACSKRNPGVNPIYVIAGIIAIAILAGITTALLVYHPEQKTTASNLTTQVNQLRDKTEVLLVATNKSLEASVAVLAKENQDLKDDLAIYKAEADAPMPDWQAVVLYDGMWSTDRGHAYGTWEYNLSDCLAPVLGDLAQTAKGKVEARKRFDELKPIVMKAVKAGKGYGWEEQLLGELDKTIGK